MENKLQIIRRNPSEEFAYPEKQEYTDIQTKPPDVREGFD